MRHPRNLAVALSAALACGAAAWSSERASDGCRITDGMVGAADAPATGAVPTPLEAAPELVPASVGRRDPSPPVETDVATSAVVEPDDEVMECGCDLEECPIRVEYVDAITAREVDVPPRLTEDRARQVNVPMPYWGRAGWRPTAPGRTRERLLRASEMTLPIHVPEPYLAWRRFEPATLSDRATSFHAVVPLDHEVDVRLRLLGDDARTDRDAIVEYWSLADTLVATPAIERLSDGSLRLRDVPWLPGESLQLGFRSHAAPTAVPDAPGAMGPSDAPAAPAAEPVDDARVFAMTIAMPDSPFEPIVRDVTPAWEAPPKVFKGHGGHRNLRAGCGCGGRRTEHGDVKVRFLDATRRALPDLRVRIGATTMLTDADGVVRLRKVLDRSDVEVVDVGYRFEPKVVYVDPGAEVSMELVEAPAGTLEVSVVDASGHAVPSATIAVQPADFGWFDVDEKGVQRLDPFTDVTGRRTCHDVPCGEATVRASYGGRRGEAKVVVVANAPSVVRITVK